MFDTILFPTDGSEAATAVEGHVFDLVATHGATLHVVNVADTAHDSVTRLGDDVVDVLEREGERIVEGVADRAPSHAVPTVTEVFQGGVPETIAEYAARTGADLVVMPTHGRTGVERFLLGSVTEGVVRRTSVPVLTVRPDAEMRHPYRRILVPTDGSGGAVAARGVGIDLAGAYTAPLHVLSVVNVANLGPNVHSTVQIDELEERATRDVDEAVDAAERASVEAVGTVEHGNPVHRVVGEYVDDRDIDLVVMGTHGRTGLDRQLLGSVAERTIRTAPVPVLVVPNPE